MNKTISLLVLIFAGTFVSRAGIHVTQSTPRKLVFEYTPNTVQTGVFSDSKGTYSFLLVDGSDKGCSSGGVSLPSTPIYAGIPQEGTVSVEYSVLSERLIRLEHPLPRASDDSVDGIEPAWVSEPEYLRFRGVRAVRIAILQARYNEQSMTVRTLEKIRCTVHFPEAPAAGSRRAGGEYEAMLRGTLLNYDIAKNWGVSRSVSLSRSLGEQAHPLSDGSFLLFDRGDGCEGFNETTNRENGVVRIDGKDLISFFGTHPAIDEIVLYASRKGSLDPRVPDYDGIPHGVTEIPLMRFDLDGDGRVDDEDYFLAYTTGTSDWAYDTGEKKHAFQIDPYALRRRYWVGRSRTIRKDGMRTFVQPSAQGHLYTSVPDGLYLRKFTGIQSGHEGGTAWYWKKLSSKAPLFECPILLPDIDTAHPCSLRVSRGRSSGAYSLSIRKGDVSICSQCNTGSVHVFDPGAGSTSPLSIRYTPQGDNRNGFIEIEAVDLRYRKRLTMSERNRVWIPSVSGTGVVGYRLSDLHEKVFLFRIPMDESRISLVAEIPAEESEYTWYDTAGTGVVYFACTENSVTRPDSYEEYRPRMDIGNVISNSRRTTNTAHYLIISPEEFTGEATRLAEHKQRLKRFSNVRVVEIEQIFREFSGGVPDPAAIRNMLLYARETWRIPPEYVLFFGNGHYDYKQYNTREKNYIPTYQSGEKCLEDFFAILDPGEFSHSTNSVADVFLGRIPCGSIDEARAAVDKIIEYEGLDADYGAWRNRFLMAADDDRQGDTLDRIVLSTPHHISSEQVENAVRNHRPTAWIQRLYLYEYPQDEFYKKPLANQALLNYLNRGVAFVNWFGHGSDPLWADEHIFTIESIGALSASNKRYPVFTSFSCSVGRFDVPDHTSLSDALVVETGRGAIVSIASTRKAYAGANTRFGTAFYDTLFNGGQKSLGYAYALAKLSMGNDENKRAYCFLGDPSLRIGVRTDSVGVAFFSSHSNDTLDSLTAMSEASVRGTVFRSGVRNVSFGTEEQPAWVDLAIFNPDHKDVGRKDGVDRKVVYDLPGESVYLSGPVPVVQGVFEHQMLLPRRVAYGNPEVRLVAYAWNNTGAFAGGVNEDIVFIRPDTSRMLDSSVPPEIELKLLDDTGMEWLQLQAGNGTRKVPSGTLPVMVSVLITDSNGIDLFSRGPGEGVTFAVPGSVPLRNLTRKDMLVERTKNCYRGTASIPLTADMLDPGVHTLVVTAQDYAGLISKDSVVFEVRDTTYTDYHLQSVYNYPNPVRSGETTRFLFDPNPNIGNLRHRPRFDARIRIYTLSGRPVRIIETSGSSYVWDCTDQFGNKLSPNIYLYSVSVRVSNGMRQFKTSKIKKLVIHPPR